MSTNTSSKDIIIGLCTSNLTDVTVLQFVNKIAEETSKKGWKLIIFSAFFEGKIDKKNNVDKSIYSLVDCQKISVMIVTQDVDALPTVKKNVIAPCLKNKIPVITYNVKTDDCYNIYFDDSTAFEHLVDHLIEKHNCKTFNIVAGVKENAYSIIRVNAFKKSLQKHNLKYDSTRIMYGDFWKEPTIACMEDFFKSKKKMPDAFVCCNDIMAMTVCLELSTHGYSVPKDVIVTGYDGSEYEQYNEPRLTTVKCGFEKLAEQTINTIQKLLHGEDVSKLQLIPANLVISQSCGCLSLNKKINNSQGYSFLYLDNITNTIYMNYLRQRIAVKTSAAESIASLKPMMNEFINDNSCIMLNKSFVEENQTLDTKDTKLSVKNKKYFDSEFEVFTYKTKAKSIRTKSVAKDNIFEFLKSVFAESCRSISLTSLFFKDEVLGFYVEEYKPTTSVNDAMHLFVITRALNQTFSYAKTKEQLQNLINNDPMTGVCNRRGFYEKINELIKMNIHKNYSLIIYSVDMDELKYINDSFGHIEGDRAIKYLAQSLEDSKNKGDIVARFGGDEFVVASISKSNSLCTKKCIEEFKNKFLNSLNEYNKISKKPYVIRASFGAKYAEVSSELKLDKIIREADSLMYKDKYSKVRNHPRI
ncbi:MAG: GGDEF domain-containing protein [Treponema sp.]